MSLHLLPDPPVVLHPMPSSEEEAYKDARRRIENDDWLVGEPKSRVDQFEKDFRDGYDKLLTAPEHWLSLFTEALGNAANAAVSYRLSGQKDERCLARGRDACRRLEALARLARQSFQDGDAA